MGKNKSVKLTTLLRMFIRVVCRFNSVTTTFFFRVSLTRGSASKIPGPLTHRPRGLRRRSLCQKTRIRSRNATTKRCSLKPTTQGGLKAATTAAVLQYSTCIPSFEFPSPTETREGVQYDLHSVMCPVVRWCCCRLSLLLRRCPYVNIASVFGILIRCRHRLPATWRPNKTTHTWDESI